MLVPIFLLLGPLRHVQGLAEKPTDADAAAGSYLAILRQPAVVWLTALTFLGTFVGYGQIEAGLPAFARSVSEVSTRVDRASVRGQHRHHRAAAVRRAPSDQWPSPHPRARRDDRRCGPSPG